MSRKIKILHIQETMASGGVERLRLSLAKKLDKSKFDQKFVCTHASGNIPEEIRAEGFEVVPIGILKSPLDWKQHKKVQKIISEYQPDIIHGAVFEGVTMAAINGWWKKVPVVIIEETSDPQNRTWKGDFLMKLFSRMANVVIGVSESVSEEYLKGKLNILPKKAITLNNGVALPKIINDEEINLHKQKWGIKIEDIVFGSIGRMQNDGHKRYSDLIKSFSLFANEKENVKLLLVGDGQEKLGYEKLTQELGVSEKVIFSGYQSDVHLFYKLMDAFALVSGREAFGLVLVEAMLNKLPVIASKVGGMKYIVENNKTGYLVEPKNVEEIADKLEILYQNNILRSEMGEAGYKKAMSHYTEDIYIKNITNLYETLIEKKGR